MQRTGIAHLPLHTGHSPGWLSARMTRPSREILAAIVAHAGSEEVLRRLCDPLWFQALGCVLRFDSHSSGVTTVRGAPKEAVRDHEADFGIWVAGGKGAASRRMTALELPRTHRPLIPPRG